MKIIFYGILEIINKKNKLNNFKFKVYKIINII